MGTNYYYHDKPDCEHCGRPHEPLHIGKSSRGWCFSLRVHPEHGINELSDWLPLWAKKGTHIRDEYGEIVLSDEMERIITDRERPKTSEFWDEETYRRNFAEPGPENLVRHSIGNGCVKHGAGTWDCIDREFS